MAAADTGDILIVSADMNCTGSLMQNVFALKFVSTVGGANITQVGILVRAYIRGVYNSLIPNMSNTIAFVAISVKNRTQSTDVGTYAWDTAWTNTLNTGTILPPADAPVLTFPTIRGKTRGRKFFPAYTVSAIAASSQLDAAALTRLGQTAAFMLAIQASGGITGMSLQYVVVSEGVGAFVAYVPTGAVVGNIVGYQTRRKQGRGR